MIAVNVEENGLRFNTQDRMPNPADIVGYCSTLAVLVRRQTRHGRTIEEIQLAHFSVKDYLTSDSLPGNLVRHFDEISARSSMAQVCLAYLLEDKPGRTVDQIRDEFPFSQYAAGYWAIHAQVSEHQSNHVLALEKELLSSQRSLRSWLDLCDPECFWSGSFQSFDAAPAIYYASLQVLSRCVQMLLEEGADANAQGGWYGSALQDAAATGHRRNVELLLDKGADINACGGEYDKALYAASCEGQLEIVQLLLDNGAEIDTNDDLFGPVVYAASAKGYEEIVRLLLKEIPEVDAQDVQIGNALYDASHEGHHKTLKQLPEEMGDVDTRRGVLDDALHIASSQGHKELVRLLLDKGADVNVNYFIFGSAVYVASSHGHYEIARLLLDRGADVDVGILPHDNALEAVSTQGHQEIW